MLKFGTVATLAPLKLAPEIFQLWINQPFFSESRVFCICMLMIIIAVFPLCCYSDHNVIHEMQDITFLRHDPQTEHLCELEAFLYLAHKAKLVSHSLFKTNGICGTIWWSGLFADACCCADSRIMWQWAKGQTGESAQSGKHKSDCSFEDYMPFTLYR